MKWYFVIILVLTTAFLVKSQNEFDECEGQEDGTYVASFSSCQTFVYCDGEDSTTGECDEGEYFDGDKGYCDLKENVRCALDEVSEEEPEEPIDGEEGPIIISTLAPATTTANINTTSPIAITIPPVVKMNCPASDDPTQVILMPNSESCSDYYLCYHGQAIEMHCTNQLHFNANTGQCDYPENVKCMIDRPNANKCLPHITDFFPHPDKCNYFYYCIKGYMTVQQCPFYYGWDIERRACVQISQAKCFAGTKRN